MTLFARDWYDHHGWRDQWWVELRDEMHESFPEHVREHGRDMSEKSLGILRQWMIENTDFTEDENDPLYVGDFIWTHGAMFLRESDALLCYLRFRKQVE